MKFSIIAATATVLSGFTSAQSAVVHNSCKSTIYVQSYPYDGGKPGALTTLGPGKTFSEKQRSSGSTIKIATTKTLTNPLFFGYSSTSNPNYAYYEFSTKYGNPFAKYANTLSPGDGCQKFACKANDAGCYSTDSMKKVYGCPQPVDLVATLCD